MDDVEVTIDGSSAVSPEPRRGADSPPSAPTQRLIRTIALLIGFLSLIALIVLAVRFGRTHATLDPTRQGADIVAILVAALIGVLASAVLILRPERGDLRRLVATSATWSIAILLVLVATWYLIDANVDNVPEIGRPISSQADVDEFLASSLAVAQSLDRPVHLVPTGVLVQSIEFLNANNVEVSGYVWQRYPPDVPADVERGVVLPEAVTAAYSADEVYRFSEANGSEVIGWYFSAELRQPFDYRHYPFDRQDVWVRLWHRDFNRDIILTPDLAAYTTLAPAALPGLEEQFVYGGWDPLFSGFSYSLNPYNTTFGYAPGDALAAVPELYFNVGLKRNFLGPFVDHFVLAAAVALLLFAVLSLTTSDEERHKRTGGLSTSGVVGSCSGLLFAVLLEHNQIRSIVASREVAYIEMLPFILYATILLVALNAVLVSSSLQIGFVRYQNNLLPDLIYWPVLLGIVLTVTLVTFY